MQACVYGRVPVACAGSLRASAGTVERGRVPVACAGACARVPEQSSAASMCRLARRGHRHVPGGSGGGTRAVGLRLRSIVGAGQRAEVKDGALSAVPARPARGLV
jgi:hypothetical protein